MTFDEAKAVVSAVVEKHTTDYRLYAFDVSRAGLSQFGVILALVTPDRDDWAMLAELGKLEQAGHDVRFVRSRMEREGDQMTRFTLLAADIDITEG